MKSPKLTIRSIATCTAVGWLAIAPGQVVADEVIIDDLIVNGSMCVGLECVDGEGFGFDTIRLISDNPQISFEDTSNNTSAFPTQDWTIGMGDGPSGTSVFFVKDANTDAFVLQMASSPSGGVALGANAVLVEDAISVGDAGMERRITHVEAGAAATDAVNMGQFAQFQSVIAAELNDITARIDALTARLDAL